MARGLTFGGLVKESRALPQNAGETRGAMWAISVEVAPEVEALTLLAPDETVGRAAALLVGSEVCFRVSAKPKASGAGVNYFASAIVEQSGVPAGPLRVN